MPEISELSAFNDVFKLFHRAYLNPRKTGSKGNKEVTDIIGITAGVLFLIELKLDTDTEKIEGVLKDWDRNSQIPHTEDRFTTILARQKALKSGFMLDEEHVDKFVISHSRILEKKINAAKDQVVGALRYVTLNSPIHEDLTKRPIKIEKVKDHHLIVVMPVGNAPSLYYDGHDSNYHDPSSNHWIITNCPGPIPAFEVVHSAKAEPWVHVMDEHGFKLVASKLKKPKDLLQYFNWRRYMLSLDAKVHFSGENQILKAFEKRSSQDLTFDIFMFDDHEPKFIKFENGFPVIRRVPNLRAPIVQFSF